MKVLFYICRMLFVPSVFLNFSVCAEISFRIQIVVFIQELGDDFQSCKEVVKLKQNHKCEGVVEGHPHLLHEQW